MDTVISSFGTVVLVLMLIHIALILVLFPIAYRPILASLDDSAVRRLQQTMTKSTLKMRARQVAAMIAEWWVMLTAGAAIIVRGARGPGQSTMRSINAALAVRPPDVMMALCALAFAVLALPFVPRTNWQGTAAVLVVAGAALSVIGRYLAYVVESPLAARVRRGSRSPYLWFFATAAIDLVCITLITHLVARRPAEAVVCADCLRESAVDVLSVAPARDTVLVGEAPGAREAIAILLAALFYVMVVRSATRRSEFERDDDDLMQLAMSHAALGEYDEAYETISKVKVRSDASRMTMAMVRIGLGELDEAWDGIKSVVELGDDEPVSFGGADDQTLLVMAGLSSGLPLGPDEVADLVVFGTTKDASDIAVRTVASQKVLILEDVQLVRVGRRVLDAVDDDRFGLTRAGAAVLADEFEQARVLLTSMASPSTVAEQIRLVTLAAVEVLDPSRTVSETNRALDEWRAAYLSDVIRLGGELDNDHHRTVAIEPFILVVTYVAEYHPAARPAFRDALRQLQSQATDQTSLHRLVEGVESLLAVD